RKGAASSGVDAGERRGYKHRGGGTRRFCLWRDSRRRPDEAASSPELHSGNPRHSWRGASPRQEPKQGAPPMSEQLSSDWLGLAGRVCIVTGGGGGTGRAGGLKISPPR